MFTWLTKIWKRLPTNFRWNIEDSFQPEDISERLLPDETPVLQIGLAWYRAFPANIIPGKLPRSGTTDQRGLVSTCSYNIYYPLIVVLA